jgi:predicted outer membrane repeat protein
MRSLDIVDSRGGSALYSEGQVELVSCTFQRCSAGLNDVERAYESSVASGGANLKSKGGAIRSEGSASSLRAIDTSFLRCFANAKGLFSSHGGAVFAMVDSEVAPLVSFVGCSFVENVANSGSDRSSGGAVEIWDAIIIVENSEFRSNEARQSGVGALTYGGAMTIVGGRRANVRIHDAVFHQNTAIGGDARAKGGAIYANQNVSLDLSKSKFSGNTVGDSRGNCEGGAILLYGGARVMATLTNFTANAACNCGAQVRGGAIHSDDGTHLELYNVTFQRNNASGGGTMTEAGALSSKGATLILEPGVVFVENVVEGKSPRGGALRIIDAVRAVITGAVFTANSAWVLAEYGYGGALHVEAGDASLTSCRFDGNTALMASKSDSLDASAGGISVGAKAHLAIDDCAFVSSYAGGVGRQEAAKSPLSAKFLGLRAAHILSQGIASVRNCTFTMEINNTLQYSAPWWIVAVGTGSVILTDCLLQSSLPPMGMLSVVDYGQALLRSCRGVNVSIDPKIAEGKLGIVDSQFSPALPSSLLVLRPPNCFDSIAGQRMCDPRAACTRRMSGGVECQCKGEGVGPPVGVRDDGSRCTTPFSLETDVAAPTVRFALLKPGKHPDQLKLHAFATGDESFNATFSRSTVLFRDGSTIAKRDDGLHARVFGLAFDWSHSKPASLVSMALDMAKQQYSATSTNSLSRWSARKMRPVP